MFCRKTKNVLKENQKVKKERVCLLHLSLPIQLREPDRKQPSTNLLIKDKAKLPSVSYTDFSFNTSIAKKIKEITYSKALWGFS